MINKYVLFSSVKGKTYNKKQNTACGSSDTFSTRQFTWRYTY